MEKIEGLIAAPYTPFDQKGELNTALIPTYADYLKRSGVKGVFVNGTTGEGPSLTAEERMQSAEAWSKNKDQQFKVIIHVGHNSLRNSQQFAKHAQEIGADGIGAMPPNFFKPTDIASLISFNASVAKAASEIGYYYYHIPSMTGVNFAMIDFIKEAELQIPNLAGIKFTHENFMDLKLCLEYDDRKYTILQGRDEVLLCGLALGVNAAIGSTYNYMAPLYLRMIEAFDQADLQLANELQLKAIKIIQVLIKYGGGIKAGKSFMRLVGLDCGNARLPVQSLTSSEEKLLQDELDGLSFQDYTIDVSAV